MAMRALIVIRSSWEKRAGRPGDGGRKAVYTVYQMSGPRGRGCEDFGSPRSSDVSLTVLCHSCGRRLEVEADSGKRKVRCPDCGVMCEVPAGAENPAPPRPRERGRPERRPAAPLGPAEKRAVQPKTDVPPKKTRPAPPATPPPRTPVSPFEDEENTYTVEGADEPTCPACGRPLAPEAVLCTRCGVDLRTGKKPVKVYEPVERHWEAGMPLRKRVTIYAVVVGNYFLLGFVATAFAGEIPAFLATFVPFAVLMAFLLGSFDRIDVTRNQRGQIRLTKTWRICFIPLAPQTFRMSQYEGLVSGQSDEVTFWDKLVFFFLLPAGLIPALIWAYYAFFHVSFFVALAKDHGFPEVILYRGWNEARMREIADTLHEVTGLPYDRKSTSSI
jgi:hypothetical protein